jgi:dTMP kinase
VTGGLLITLEGIEGSGKSTQAFQLQLKLEALKVPVLLTREPGGTPVAERIRDVVLGLGQEPVDARAELLLFLAARAQHVARKIRPALTQGRVVICDRFTDATLAYQGGGRTIPDEFLRSLNDWATSGVRPDRTYLIDVPVEVGSARARSRSRVGRPDRMEAEGLAFFEAVRARYLEIAAREPERVLVVRGMDSLESISHQIVEDLSRLLGARAHNPQR